MSFIGFNNQNFLALQKTINIKNMLNTNRINENLGSNDVENTNDVDLSSNSSNNISDKEKLQILQEIRIVLREKDEKWGVKNWNLNNNQIEYLYNRLISDATIKTFSGTKEDFEKLIKVKLVVLYSEMLSSNVLQNFRFISTMKSETLQTFEDKINSGEFNKEVTKDETTKYINQYAEFIKSDLKKRYNYSDSYLDNIINVATENIFKTSSSTLDRFGGYTNSLIKDKETEKFNLQDILKQFKTNITNILKEPNLIFNSGIHAENLFAGSIFPFSTQRLESFSKSDDIQLQLLSKLFTSVIDAKGFNEEEANAFIELVFLDCGANRDNSFQILSLTMEDFIKLDKNGDGNWFDELSNIINKVAARYSHMEQSEIDSAETIDAEQFIRNFATHGMTDYTMVDKIVMQLNEMTLSDDPAMRKLAQMFNTAFEKYNCQYDDEKKYLVRMILMFLGQKSGDTIDTQKFFLTEDNIEQLNKNNIFVQMQEIIDTLSNYSMVHNSYYQGHTYYIQKENDIYTITDTDTLETTIVDLNILVGNLPEDKKEEALKSLRIMPAEVLIDMLYESTFIAGSLNGTAGTYWSATDNIKLNEYDIGTMIHETGHALANTKCKDFSHSSEFVNIFNKELEAYIAAGNIQPEICYTNDSVEVIGLYPFNGSNYCTSNPREFFAECYTLLMLGDGYRAECIIEQYFPQSLNMVKEYLEQIRNLSPNNRRK